MIRRISTLICIVLTLPSTVYAVSAPTQLFGRSIVLSWRESRVRKTIGDNQFSHAQVGRENSIYFSSAGRVFNREVSSEQGTSAAATEQVPDSTRSSRGNPQSAHFEGRTLLVDTEFVSGARRVIIEFDEGFRTCNAKIIYGKNGGAKPIITNSLRHPGLQYEHQSVEVQNLSCAIKDVNVFGGQ